jgi:hypothetical protein
MVYIPLPHPFSGFPMPKSKLVTITENKIEVPEDYRVFTPKENILVITKEFTTQYAIIELTELKLLQNTIQRKSIVPSIITALSWTPEVEKELQSNGRKAKKAKNGNKVEVQPPRITMLNFIKPKKVVVVQQQQNQQQ